ncbi:MAG TPA: hypothetical protein VF625_19180, partial [Longimicrobium sp.]
LKQPRNAARAIHPSLGRFTAHGRRYRSVALLRGSAGAGETRPGCCLWERSGPEAAGGCGGEAA